LIRIQESCRPLRREEARSSSVEAKKWMALALTKKTKLKIRAKMPKRQFIGESRELVEKVNKEVNDSIQRIKDGISTL